MPSNDASYIQSRSTEVDNSAVSRHLLSEVMSFDANKNGALSRDEIIQASQKPSLTVEDRDKLKVLNDHYLFFSALDYEHSSSGITPAGLAKFDSWNNLLNTEVQELASQSPKQADAIKFLNENSDYLDPNGNGKIEEFEVAYRLGQETDPAKSTGLQNLKDNFALMAEPAPPIGEGIELRGMDAITAASVTDYLLKHNANYRGQPINELRKSILAVELVELNQSPGIGLA